MRKHLAQLTSLVLVIALLCTFMVPVSAADSEYWWTQYVDTPMENWGIDNIVDGAVHSTNQYILFTSDLHRYTYLAKDLLAAANGLIKSDGNEYNVGLFAGGGDFANEKVLYADNMSILKDAIQSSEGTVATYTKGNHEGNVSDEDFEAAIGMSRIGETCINDSGDYYFYNFGAYNGTQQFLDEDITALSEYLDAHNDGKPIFIVSHYPLHYYNDRRCSKKAADVVALLNNYPQVVFLWGHNHTESDPAYGYIRTAGDIIQPAANEDTTVEINFTYANLGALRDGTNGANGVLARVNDDGTVLFRYINLHNTVGDHTWIDAQGNENAIRDTTVYEDAAQNIDGEAVTAASQPDLKNITLANIKIDRPLVDKTPAETATEYSDRFSSSPIIWTDAEGNEVTGSFDFNTAYTATVNLVAEDGYSFDPAAAVSVNKTYVGPMPGQNNQEADVTISEDGKTASLAYTFAATTAEGSEAKDAATEITEGKEYVLAAIEDNYAASYMYNPADHGDESKPEYTAASSDIVIRNEQLVSELSDSMIFTAVKDATGYILYSDASLQASFPEDGPTPDTANFLNMSTRGGDLGLEAAESLTVAANCDWNIDENGLPYIDMDGAKAYAAYSNGFTFVTDPAACNVRLYEVGTDDDGDLYCVNVQVEAPVAGAKASTTATCSAGCTIESVTWNADTFEADTSYTVTITAVPDAGCNLKSMCIGRVNGYAADYLLIEDGKAVIAYTFITPAAAGKALSVTAKAVDSITAGKTYVVVTNGIAMTDSNVGVYGSGVVVNENEGVLASPITPDMLITMEGDETNGYYMKTAAGYIKGKTEGDKPDAWGLMYTDTATMTFNYIDGHMQVISTGDTKGGGSSKSQYLYENDGHFNYFTLKPDVFTLYEVSTSFTDVSGYSVDAINWAAINGVAYGKAATLFAPKDQVTRAEALTMIWRAAGCPAPTADAAFEDVPADSYYADAVAWAVENGITYGTSAKAFSPDLNCSRAEIVTFLYRLAGKPTAEGENAFTDVAADSYYADAVAWAAAEGITFGTSATTFSPNGTCTREEAVSFLYRYETK